MASLEESKRDQIHLAGLQSTAFLFSLAEVVIAWLLVRHAEVAHTRLVALEDGGSALPGRTREDEIAFYTGRIASARWFVRNVLPKVTLRRDIAQQEDGALMALPTAAF
jgi:hypothetical protein